MTKVLETLDKFTEEMEIIKADHTVNSYRSHLRYFAYFVDGLGVDVEDIDARLIDQYRRERFVENDEEYRDATVRTQLNTIRVYLRWCADRAGLIDRQVVDNIRVPNKTDGQRSDILPRDTVSDILDYLSTYHYASRYHALLSVMWDTGCRGGAIRSIDVDDIDTDDARITLHHRPATDTPLKNGEGSERVISLRPDTADVVADYISTQRLNETDDHGRDPLFTTTQGRVSRSWLRQTIYRLSQPCYTGASCPHDKDPQTCDAALRRMDASQCPSSVSPHAVRRGRITHLLSESVDEQVISQRSDVSREVIENNYDARTPEEKLDQRRNVLDNLDD